MRHLACAVASVAFAACAADPTPARPVLSFRAAPDDSLFGTLEVTSLPHARLARLEMSRAEWNRLLAVYVGEAARDEQPAVLGAYTAESNAIRFRPRFPFKPGLTYRARFDGAVFDSLRGMPDAGTASGELRFAMPLPDREPTTFVEAVYPSADLVPENLLRVYIHFSAPMAAKDIDKHVHLFDATGREVALPFVEVRHGLWDAANRRLTLFFHPGRLKRGVAPRLVLGPPLRQGETYRLVVDREALDAAGDPLRSRFEKLFRVGAADRSPPDPVNWKLNGPRDRGAPVWLELAEPMDCALLLRHVVVEDATGLAVSGHSRVTEHETRWSFAPDVAWAADTDYFVSVGAALEDLAGNRPGHLFDQDLAATSGASEADPLKGSDRGVAQSQAPIRLRFRVVGGGS